MSSTAPHSFLKDLERLEQLAYAPVIGPEGLARTLGKMYQAVATADFSSYDILAVRKAAPASTKVLSPAASCAVTCRRLVLSSADHLFSQV